VKTLVYIATAAVVLSAAPAFAHITLEQREATIGAPVKLTFRVPHGCGQSPTTKVRLRIPDGVIAVKPMPKPGWTLDLVEGPYDKTYAYFHGAKLSQGVKEVSWSGNLPDKYYDEFVINGFIGDGFAPGSMLYFPVVQECADGVHRWIEIPKASESSGSLQSPAPGLKLNAK
jgi:uncharacterized protein YcnI